MNWEVSKWMRGPRDSDDSPQIPFIATSGYNSVVWNRLYSRDVSDLDGHQINQASLVRCIQSPYFVAAVVPLKCGLINLAGKC